MISPASSLTNLPHPLQEQPQLLLVICRDQRSRLPTTGALTHPINGRLALIHPTEVTSRPPVTIIAWHDPHRSRWPRRAHSPLEASGTTDRPSRRSHPDPHSAEPGIGVATRSRRRDAGRIRRELRQSAYPAARIVPQKSDDSERPEDGGRLPNLARGARMQLSKSDPPSTFRTV